MTLKSCGLYCKSSKIVIYNSIDMANTIKLNHYRKALARVISYDRKGDATI